MSVTGSRHWFVLAWALACRLGGLAFGALSSANLVLACAALGVLLGVPQAPVLHGFRHPARAWLVLTSAGMLIAWPVGFVAGYLLIVAGLPVLTSPIGGLLALIDVGVATALAGLTVGLIQTCAPHAHNTHSRWASCSALGAVVFWAVALGVPLPFGGFLDAEPALRVAGGALAGLAYGLVSGTCARQMALLSWGSRQTLSLTSGTMFSGSHRSV